VFRLFFLSPSQYSLGLCCPLLPPRLVSGRARLPLVVCPGVVYSGEEFGRDLASFRCFGSIRPREPHHPS